MSAHTEIEDLGNRSAKTGVCALIGLGILILAGILVAVVCREVDDAFRTVDEALQETKTSSTAETKDLRDALEVLNVDPSLLSEIDAHSTSLTTLADSIRELIVMETGGWEVTEYGKRPSNPKDMAVSHRILLTEGYGDQLEQQFKKTSAFYQEQIKHFSQDEVVIPLQLFAVPAESEKTWAEYCFGHMPLQAILPLFSKIEADEISSKNLLYRAIIDQTTSSLTK